MIKYDTTVDKATCLSSLRLKSISSFEDHPEIFTLSRIFIVFIDELCSCWLRKVQHFLKHAIGEWLCFTLLASIHSYLSACMKILTLDLRSLILFRFLHGGAWICCSDLFIFSHLKAISKAYTVCNHILNKRSLPIIPFSAYFYVLL